VKERDRLFDLLKEVPFLKPFPSHSNFILCEVTSGFDAKKVKVHSFSYLIFTSSYLFYSLFVYV
jgi:histidinol-phosphate/aromatic aminotransferase/cobyric acid decarboxylase-like protein